MEGVPVGTGVLIGGGGIVRGDCTGEMLSVALGEEAGLTVAVGAGTMGGVARKSMAGEGRILGGTEAVAAAAGEGDAATAGVIEGLSFG